MWQVQTKSSSPFPQILWDGCEYFARNSIGNPTTQIERWSQGGTTYYRTNNFGYSTDGIDLLTVTNASGIRVSSNYFNSYHQVLTNYDALNQPTLYTYDSNRRLSTVQTAAGLFTTATTTRDCAVA